MSSAFSATSVLMLFQESRAHTRSTTDSLPRGSLGFLETGSYKPDVWINVPETSARLP